MTIKKKIFYSNTIMVLLSLIILLGIGGGMVSLFKDEFFAKFTQSSEINANVSKVEAILEDPDNADLSMEQWDAKLSRYDFRFCVLKADGHDKKKVWDNLYHREWETVEEIKKNEYQTNQARMYLLEGATLVATEKTGTEGRYTIIAVYSSEDAAFWGLDRGFFEMFIIVFLVTGIVAVLVILLCNQIASWVLLRRIMKPLDVLNEATQRIGAGDLDEKIDYMNDDEFKPVCDSFDLMQMNLKESMEKQQAYEKARTEMVSGISHDLRTPLTSIKGYIKGLMDGIANTEEKQMHYLSTAYQKSCDMDVLLSKLFYFSKLETGNMPFYKQKTDMNQMLREYVDDKEKEYSDQNVEVIMENRSGKQEIYCDIDRDQTKRVFDNLIENSMKYAQTEELKIKVLMQKEKGRLNLIFKDNGVGLEQKKVAHVFEQFYRGDESRTSKNEGNGLGLYVCKYIVEQQDGTIEAYCDNGFCVSICLPIMDEE